MLGLRNPPAPDPRLHKLPAGYDYWGYNPFVNEFRPVRKGSKSDRYFININARKEVNMAYRRRSYGRRRGGFSRIRRRTTRGIRIGYRM